MKTPRKLVLALAGTALMIGALIGLASARDQATSGAAFAWPTFHYASYRDGVNPLVFGIGPSNVGQLSPIWKASLPGVADSTPVYRSGRLYLTLTDGSLVALNVFTGGELWRQTTTGPGFTTSSPTLDPSGAWVYSYGLDGFVHKYAASNGQESIGGGFPAKITNLPTVEKGSSSLNLGAGYLYMTTSGYPGDQGHYDGHLVAVNLANGTEGVFNSLCSNIHALLVNQPGQPNYCANVQSGVWARSGAVVDPVLRRAFIATGNGLWDGQTNWGDSVLALSPNGITLLDSYTPTNQSTLDQEDLDLGSSAPALFPTQSSSKTPYLAAQVGKDGLIRLLNRQNLSGTGRPGALGGELQLIAAPGSCEVLTAPVVWTDPSGRVWLFVANDCGLNAYNLVTSGAGVSELTLAWQQSQGGTSPVLGGGVLYVERNNGGAVDAYDPTTGAVLWSSTRTSATIGSVHWQSPIVLDTLLIVPDNNGNVFAFGSAR